MEPLVFCASVVYPLESEGFDFEYFRDRHVPLFTEMLGESCVRVEVHRGLAAPGAPPPPFVAAAYFWVRSAEEFGAALAEHASTIYADIDNFSQTQPVRGWAEVSNYREAQP
jgi:uncharacterized protein (TIGR02118 family)